MKNLFIFLLSLFLIPCTFAQTPDIEWQNSLGGTSTDEKAIVRQTNDGGYIVGGNSYSGIGAEKTVLHFGGNSSTDIWVVKLNASGNILWQKNIGGTDWDYLSNIIQTSDNGYLIAAGSGSDNSGNKTEDNLGAYPTDDCWIIKLDSLGNIEWDNTIGGNDNEFAIDISQTSDGGYIIGAVSLSGISDDKEEINYGDYDYWIVKLNSSGIIEWQNTIGGDNSDDIYEIFETGDGGYFLGGISNSGISIDKTEANIGAFDYWLVKLNGEGEIEWQNTIGGEQTDYLSSAKQTADGGFIIAGYSYSGISGDKVESSNGSADYWVLKINASGEIEWQNTIGGDKLDVLREMNLTSDGGCILAGYSASGISGDKTEPFFDGASDNDYWIIKLDAFGNIQWQNTIGGLSADMPYSIQQTLDFGYIVAGSSLSGITGDKTDPNNGGYDFWVIKLLPDCFIIPELCNSLDDNCNGLIDDGITETISISAGGPISFCQGGSVLLTATYSGASVQWKKNGTIIPGATSITYNVTTKGNYSCVTTSACGTAESTPIFVNVIKNPNASISAGGPTTFCAGGSVVLTEVASPGCSYQWYKGANPIAGATSLTYTATTSGNYKCRVIKAATGCYKNSNAIGVSVPCREGDNITQSNFSLYPNPANNFITIETDFSTEKTICITDALGQIVKTITTSENNITIDLQGVAAGVYFIKMEDGINSVTQKFVKQ